MSTRSFTYGETIAMNSFDKKYQDLLRSVRDAPTKPTRQGVDAHTIAGTTFEHYMSEGFPLTTLRKIRFDLIASELQFNILGLTDKRWLQERGNHIWDPWCDPTIVPYGRDDATKVKMRTERDLGPLYGFQWRHFGAEYRGYDEDYRSKGIDQLATLLETLRKDPNSKRMVVTSWNPIHLHRQSIPPCPFAFEVSLVGGEMHLFFFQRSVDVMLGFPFDFAQHALLLHLLCKETGFKIGKAVGFFANVELYTTHTKEADELLRRNLSEPLPTANTENFRSLFEWEYPDTKLVGYAPLASVKLDVVV